ncbi:MAG: hypothetical protein Kow00102_20640 [Spirochaetota bacterium]
MLSGLTGKLDHVEQNGIIVRTIKNPFYYESLRCHNSKRR